MSSSWVRRAPDFRDRELKMLEWKPQTSEALAVRVSGSNSQDLKSDVQWNDYLDNYLLPANAFHDHSRVHLIMGSRTSHIGELPFSKDAFSRIQKVFNIHSSIVPVINRSSSCFFIGLPCNWPSEDGKKSSIVYNCRTVQTSDTWPGEMVLSVTYFPDTMITNAVWLGCDLTKHDENDYIKSNSELISRSLAAFDGDITHPMILPLIFADIERDRHADLVRASRARLPQKLSDLTASASHSERKSAAKEKKSANLGYLTPSMRTASSGRSQSTLGGWLYRSATKMTEASEVVRERKGSDLSEMTPPEATPVAPLQSRSSIDIWTDVAHLKNALVSWQAQLKKMAEHLALIHDPTEKFAVARKWEHSKLRAWEETSNRFGDRLRELIDEYDTHIRECTCIMDGLALASQMELNNISSKDAQTNSKIAQVNLKIATMARQDGSLMRWIATLGMIFLPATFLFAFFSMDFFDWKDTSSHGGMSPFFWVYVGAAAGLTVFTLGVFYGCVLRQKRMSYHDLEESLD